MGRLQPGVNDLYTWCLNNSDFGQQLIKEWAGITEDNQPISINNIANASNKKVKWKCERGHEWYAMVVNRTRNKQGCPYCYGKLAATENNLKTWCLNNGKLGQQLIREWAGLDENNQPISMDSVAKGSRKRVKWRCEQGHEWYKDIDSRTRKKTGCPYCSGRYATEQNDLKQWCLNNGDWGKQLISEWAGLDENNQPISMEGVAKGSRKRVKWRCKNKHTWVTKIAARTHSRTGCPYCFQQSRKGSVRGIISLFQWCLNHGEYGQQLMDEWTPRVNGKPSGMDLVSYGSQTEATWKCKNGHTWKTTIANRTCSRIGCPYCSGCYVTEQNSLKTWCLNNGKLGQQLIREWAGVDENNQPISMDSVSYGSDKKVKWKCLKGHEWYTMIRNRTRSKQGCPYCANLVRSKKQHK